MVRNPSDDMPAAEAMASLLARVCAARVLREHHVWEAVRILPDVAGLCSEIKHAPSFRALMEKNAFREALSLLAEACHPARRFRVIGQIQGRWVCVLQFDMAPAHRRDTIVRVAHADPAAAILAALLRSCSGQCAGAGQRTRLAEQIEAPIRTKQGATHG